MVKIKRKILVLTALFALILLLSLLQIVNLSHAQINGNSLSINNTFEMREFAEDLGQILNTSSIDIQLPSDQWNITEVELNFTEIKLKREIEVVEDKEFYGQNYIYYTNPMFKRVNLGVQLNILETTTIYGVYIYGRKVPGTVIDIKFQINGYDETNNGPNNTIYRQIDLNISYTDGWYYQDFSSSPKTLTKGNYSLVMNGTEIEDITDKDSIYYWKFNEIEPITPNLYISEYVNSWSIGKVNSTYLHKIVQKRNVIYWPEVLSMRAEIDGQDYDILNGSSEGTGNLTLTGLNFAPTLNFNIPIKTNQSIQLVFNVNYSIKAEGILYSDSTVLITENQPNLWSLTFNTTRYFITHSIMFYYLKSWINLFISRDSGQGFEDITLDITNNEIDHILIFSNDTIINAGSYQIKANSPNIDFNLIFPNYEWEIEKKLQFSVEPPIIQGNLTFVLINTLGFSEIIDVKEVNSEEIVFTFDIPSTYLNGTYIAKVYWNNNTDAGVQSQVFSITIPETPPSEPTPSEPLNPRLIILIVSASVGATLTGFVSYRVVKSMRIKRAEEAQKVYNKCMDILNLDYLMVTEKKSGLNVYEQKFTGKEMNGTLISGFLQALHLFGIKLTKVEDQSQTIKLEYANSIVLMTEFVNLRLILIMRESPSKNFLYSLEDLAYDIYKEYGNLVEDFNGDIKPFKGIEELLRQHLNISFIYPLKLVTKASSKKIKINQDERAYINKAFSFMKQTKKDYFYIASLLPEKICSPKNIDYIMNLIEKNIFQPIIK